MIFLKLLLSSGIIFLAATISLCNESYQPSMYIKPMHYDIEFTLYFEENLFYGACNISINIPYKARIINLNLEKLDIEGIALFRYSEKYDENDRVMIYKPTYIRTNIATNTIEIFFENELSPGDYTLYIRYNNTIDDGVFRIFSMEESTAWVADTHLQKKGACRLFPCWDKPDLEAIFNISVGCDRQYTILSNMPVRDTEIKYKMLWTYFETSPAMSPYLATMIVFNNFVHLHDTGIITMWCRAHSEYHMEFAKNVAENITLNLKYEWKRSNSISNINHIAIPNFQDKGIAVLGLVLHKETNIIYNENLYPITRKIEIVQSVGHKVIQEWFYNLFNSFNRSDFWLNEGLPTLFEMNAVNKIFLNKHITNLLFVKTQHNALHLDGDYYMWPSTSQVNSSLEIPNSIRAFCILRMLERRVTDKLIFWKGVRSYVNSTQLHRQNFTNFMAKVVIEASISDKFLQAMQYWLTEKHYPVINAIRNNTKLYKLDISIQNFDTLRNICIPLTYATKTNPDFINFVYIWLNKLKHFVGFIPVRHNDWVIFNVQQIEYYRVNYDEENWRRISDYLNSDNYMKIHIFNRAQIIDDAFHLMIARQLNPSIFWNLISYLHREINYVAWYPTFKALEYIFSTFPFFVLEENIEAFTTIEHTLNKVLEGIEYKEIDDTDELRISLRQEAAKWACFFHHIICQLNAEYKLEKHLENPETHRLLPWWKKWTYCNGLMTPTQENSELIWNSLYNIGLNKSDTKFFESLACTKHFSLIKHYLNLIKNKTNQNITEPGYQNHVHGFLHIIIKHANNPFILNYILEKFNEIKPKHVSMTTALTIIINNIYSVQPIKQINRYVEKLIEGKLHNITSEVPSTNLGKIQNIVGDIKQLEQDIRFKISIRFHQIQRQKRYFKSFFL